MRDVDGDEVWSIGKDTVRIDDEVMVNGEDFLLRRMAGHVVMSQPVTETGHWEVFLLKREGDVFRTATFEDDESWLKQTATFMESPREQKKSGASPGIPLALQPHGQGVPHLLKEGVYDLEEGSVPLPRGAGSGHQRRHLRPIDAVEYGRDVIRPAVLIVQVVGVLPDVDAEERTPMVVGLHDAFHQGVVLVGGRTDEEPVGLILVLHQPGPAEPKRIRRLGTRRRAGRPGSRRRT